MRDFIWVQPDSLEEACAQLAGVGEDGRAIAGGTALMLAMRQRMLAPSHVVSLGRLTALREIRVEADGSLTIGALARHADVARAAAVREGWPVLASMAERVANPQVRNQGTIGGNLCYADPATDPPGCLLALGARVHVRSARGERVLPMDDFLLDYYTTALEPGEILTAIRVPALASGSVARYARFLRTAAEHRPLVNVSVVARREGGVCRDPRLVIGASTAVATRAAHAEAMLDGRELTRALAAQAADAAADGLDDLLSDARGDAEYRREMVRVVVRRALADAFGLEPEQ